MNTIADRLRALADEVAALEAGPAPEPAPAPEPPPAPEPAPVTPPAPAGSAPTIMREPINKKAVAWPTAWAWSPNYQRSTGLISWQAGARVSVEYQRGSLDGTPAVRRAGEYTLRVDGVAVSTVQLAETVRKWKFDFNAPTAPGWHTLTVDVPEGESQITYFAMAPGDADWSLIPAVQSSLELSHRYSAEDSAHAWAWVPSAGAVARPTPDHLYEPVTLDTEQTVDLLVPGDSEPPATPVQRADGSWQTMANQAYFWDQIALRTLPDVHLKDGPRGIGTFCFATHIEIGKGTQNADPSSAPRRNVYACDPWRVVRISNTGHITTLAGYRHATGASDVPPDLVGDWSAIPAERHGFRLLWGMCWDSRTTLRNIDTSAAPIPSEDNRQPHLTGPRMYVTDSRWNRLCRIEFDGKSHATPAKVSEIAVDLPGAWDCVEDESTATMIVSLREAHKVVRMTFDGEIVETLIERDAAMPGDAAPDTRHIVRVKSGTLEELQAQPVVSPEGLYLLDGLLCVGSLAQRQITVLDLATKQIVRRVPITVTGNSMFVKLAVSDGSYAPRGTIFFCTFDISNGARWYGIKPDGGRWASSSASFYPLSATSYQMAVGVGGGRMIVGGSDFGLVRFYKGPRLDVAKYRQGEAEFKAMHGRIVYGAQAVGRFDIPADASEALRYFVACNYAGVL